MKKYYFFIAFLVVGLSPLYSQTETPFIEVTGSAEMELDPNIIIISVRLEEYIENKESAYGKDREGIHSGSKKVRH